MIKSKNSERKITNHLQQDVVKVSGKTIFINPFLYWRRFDENTNRWLREPGQMSEDQISPNRNRFYPEIEWADLSHEQKLIKDATVYDFITSKGGFIVETQFNAKLGKTTEEVKLFLESPLNEEIYNGLLNRVEAIWNA